MQPVCACVHTWNMNSEQMITLIISDLSSFIVSVNERASVTKRQQQRHSDVIMYASSSHFRDCRKRDALLNCSKYFSFACCFLCFLNFVAHLHGACSFCFALAMVFFGNTISYYIHIHVPNYFIYRRKLYECCLLSHWKWSWIIQNLSTTLADLYFSSMSIEISTTIFSRIIYLNTPFCAFRINRYSSQSSTNWIFKTRLNFHQKFCSSIGMHRIHENSLKIDSFP